MIKKSRAGKGKKKIASMLAENLGILLKEHGINESELSRRTNIQQPVLNRIRNGETLSPNLEILMTLANYFAISIDQLIGYAHLPTNFSGKHTNSHFGWNEVPILSWQECGKYKADQEKCKAVDYICIDIDLKGRDIFALVVDNNRSMPSFKQGSYLIFEIGNTIKDGDYFLMQTEKNAAPALREAMFDGEDLYAVNINKSIEEYKKITDPSQVLAVLVQYRYDFIRKSGASSNDTNIFRELKIIK